MGVFTTNRRRGGKASAEADARLDTLRASDLVDTEWYLRTYPDVAAAGIDPTAHYLDSGAAEGRDPNPLFQTSWYLERYPDVAAAGLNPLIHFLEMGAKEGRDPGPGFDTGYYSAENPAVDSAGINPLAHYLRFGQAEGRIPRPRDQAEGFEVAIRAKRLGLGGAAAALFRGAKSDHIHFPLGSGSTALDPRGLALPPFELAARIGSTTWDDYESIGEGTYRTIVRALPKDFSFDGARCLDFGCGVARVLRHFAEEARRAEFWGCDIDGASIRWCVEHLTPPYRFVQIGEIPTIPFEDNSFDLIYAISVFSHIHIDWHHWMMEIRRILKPGGTFFVTFMGPTVFEEMLSQSYWNHAPDFGMYVKNPHNNWNAGGPMVFLSPAWIQTFWGGMFDVEFIAIDGLLEYQSFCVLRKPVLNAPRRPPAPVLELGTSQPFDPDAVGRILARIDGKMPFLESYGIDVRGRGEIEGWIVFRERKPARLDLFLDGQPLEASTSFERGPNYRDWPDTSQFAWSATFDPSTIPAGEHRLEARFRSEDGHAHAMSIPLIVRAG